MEKGLVIWTQWHSTLRGAPQDEQCFALAVRSVRVDVRRAPRPSEGESVLGEQAHPQLILDHRRQAATQYVHAAHRARSSPDTSLDLRFTHRDGRWCDRALHQVIAYGASASSQEELHRVSRSCTLQEGAGSTLCNGVSGFTIHRRLASRGWSGGCLVTNILPTVGQPSLVTLQPPGRIDTIRCAQRQVQLSLARVTTEVTTDGVWREWSESFSDGGQTWFK